MQVISSQEFSKFAGIPTATAIGAFDGLHLGHQQIIRQANKQAREQGLYSAIFSFEPHPMEIIEPDRAPSRLISRDQKIELLEGMGLDFYFEQEFTGGFSRLSIQEFVVNILISRLNVREIIVGSDFRFGRGARGSTDDLQQMAENNGFRVLVVDPVRDGGYKISSSRIRGLISEGKVSLIPEYLGRSYCLQGRVVSGYGRGRQLGVPTANLEPLTNYVLPPAGVYAVFVDYQGRRFKGVANFGTRPTFDEVDYSIEIHLIDRELDLYGEVLEIELMEYVRPEKSFATTEELVTQIKRDILYTDSILCYNN
ncbi:MAG: bifunctional riboflavin kinase/FAD synthetase [Bacillota bacterium]